MKYLLLGGSKSLEPRGDVSRGYALVLHVARISEIDGSISTETTTCECGQATEPTRHIITMPITRTSLHFGEPSEVQRKCQRMCRQMEECGLKTRKKKYDLLLYAFRDLWKHVLTFFTELSVSPHTAGLVNT